jgi:hypothetical protein
MLAPLPNPILLEFVSNLIHIIRKCSSIIQMLIIKIVYSHRTLFKNQNSGFHLNVVEIIQFYILGNLLKCFIVHLVPYLSVAIHACTYYEHFNNDELTLLVVLH